MKRMLNPRMFMFIVGLVGLFMILDGVGLSFSMVHGAARSTMRLSELQSGKVVTPTIQQYEEACRDSDMAVKKVMWHAGWIRSCLGFLVAGLAFAAWELADKKQDNTNSAQPMGPRG